jgi:hypothetical protein
MMNLNSNYSMHGFTIIETLLAMALVGLSLGPVIGLQSSTARRVIDRAERLDRMFTAYDFFLLYTGGDEEQANKTSTDPEVKLRYERTPARQESRLAKEFNHLFLEIVSWEWEGERGTIKDRFACIQFMPPEPPEKPATPEKAPEKKPATPAAPAKPGASKPATPPAPAGATT